MILQYYNNIITVLFLKGTMKYLHHYECYKVFHAAQHSLTRSYWQWTAWPV